MSARQSLKRKDIVAALMDADLPQSDYWVIMGAALVLHGVRSVTSDIDLALSDSGFGRLLESGHSPLVSRSGRSKLAITVNITGYKDWCPSSWVTMQEIQVATLESVVAEKGKLARAKDLDDIAIVRLYQELHDGVEK
jgi:hypothetical protein